MQRAIWIITFFIILAIGYYWMVVDDTRTQRMTESDVGSEDLSPIETEEFGEDVPEWEKKLAKLEKK